mmetsp:Transcript_3323/g.7384  ORF Transcript_3323/g.7384 Transcript_3323/m.7384 type:complete len:215 (+) Transcript_3323:480-1124(+)
MHVLNGLVHVSDRVRAAAELQQALVEGLHAHADSRDAQRGEIAQLLAVESARVGLNGNFAVWRNAKDLVDGFQHTLQLRRRGQRGRATAEKHGLEGRAWRPPAAVSTVSASVREHLLAQDVHIVGDVGRRLLRGPAGFRRAERDDREVAVPALAAAERKVDIGGERLRVDPRNHAGPQHAESVLNQPSWASRKCSIPFPDSSRATRKRPSFGPG